MDEDSAPEAATGAWDKNGAGNAPTEVVVDGAADTGRREQLAWSEEPEPHPRPASSWRSVLGGAGRIVLGTAMVVMAVVAASLVIPRHHRAAAARPPAAAVDGPVDPRDKQFINQMNYYHVPVPDWRFTVNQGRSLCAMLDEEKAPPGNDTIQKSNAVMTKEEPSWNEAQVSYFVAQAITVYCPKYWIPTDAQLAQMPPDDRYMALLESSLGFEDTKDNRASLTIAAHTVCSQLSDGSTGYQVIDHLLMPGNTVNGDAITRDQATQIVDSAIRVYCPQFTPPQ